MTARAKSRLLDLGWSLLLGFGVLGPLLLRRGFALRGDMVFVPHQPWKPAWLGLDGSVGRAVPVDAVISLATQVVPGDLLQKAVLLVTLVVAGVGAARLAAAGPFVARAAAATVYVWNPWVHERLAIGQWGTVLGYAMLPWVAITAARYRDDPRLGWPALTVGLAVCAVATPSAAVLAGFTALLVVLTRPRTVAVLGVLAVQLLLSLPWVVPALLTDSRAAAGGQFEAFAARGESALGVVASVLSLGGIWKASVVPPEREVVLIVAASLVPSVIAVGCLVWKRRAPRADVPGLGWLAAAGAALALLPSIPGVASALDDLSRQVPAVGMVRDSQRFLAPAGLLLAYGAAVLVGWLWDNAQFDGRRLTAVLVLLWPVLCLPSLAWGLHGGFTPVRYPAEWELVASIIDRAPGTTVVLPWRGGYRGYAWNHRHASLDPAPRFFPGGVLIDDRVFLRDRVLASEDPLLRRVDAALRAPDPADALRHLGVDRVLVEKGNGVEPNQIPTGRTVHDGTELRLVDLGAATTVARSRPSVRAVACADVLAGVTLALAVTVLTRRYVYDLRQPGGRRRPGFTGRKKT